MKVFIKNLKFALFPIYVLVTLIKSKQQIHGVTVTNPDTLKLLDTMEFISWSYK